MATEIKNILVTSCIELYLKTLETLLVPNRKLLSTYKLFSKKHCIVDLYTVCLKYVTGVKINPASEVTYFT